MQLPVKVRPANMETDVHFKRGRTRNQRAGCKLCKPWKANGVRNERLGGERFSDHRRRLAEGVENDPTITI